VRPTLKDFKEKALANPEVAAEYNRLSAAYESRKQLIKIRKEAGLTQEQIAEILHTRKSNFSDWKTSTPRCRPSFRPLKSTQKLSVTS